jgi:hypothetical protein
LEYRETPLSALQAVKRSAKSAQALKSACHYGIVGPTKPVFRASICQFTHVRPWYTALLLRERKAAILPAG